MAVRENALGLGKVVGYVESSAKISLAKYRRYRKEYELT